MRKLLLVMVWFPATILSLIWALLILTNYTQVEAGNELLAYQAREMFPKNGFQFYAALPEVLGSFSTAIETGDARPEILKQFLQKYDSPLLTHADLMIQSADEYNIDFRLMTAIAMCESNLGKKIPENSYNAWGYAIYTGQNNGVTFSNWEQAIKVMAEYLATKFYQQGLTTPDEIGPIYAPPSVNTDNSWAKCVSKYIDELR